MIPILTGSFTKRIHSLSLTCLFQLIIVMHILIKIKVKGTHDFNNSIFILCHLFIYSKF